LIILSLRSIVLTQKNRWAKSFYPFLSEIWAVWGKEKKNITNLSKDNLIFGQFNFNLNNNLKLSIKKIKLISLQN
jgi:hypothetical protein